MCVIIFIIIFIIIIFIILFKGLFKGLFYLRFIIIFKGILEQICNILDIHPHFFFFLHKKFFGIYNKIYTA